MRTTRVEHVVTVLAERGHYARQPQLILVDDVDFEFDAVLRGPNDSQGLVVVVEGGGADLRAALPRLRALSRGLLRKSTMRPLTLIVVANVEASDLLRDLSAICRVVQVQSDDVDGVTRELRFLLPLSLPAPQGAHADPMRQLREMLGNAASDPIVAALLAAARKGEAAVEKSLIDAIGAASAERTDGGAE